MKTFIEPSSDKWPGIIQRPIVNNDDLVNIVADILKDVKQNGDNAIKKYCLQFGKASLTDLKVSAGEIKFVLARKIGKVEFGLKVPKALLQKTLMFQPSNLNQ